METTVVRALAGVLLFFISILTACTASSDMAPIVSASFIYEDAAFAEAHASTIVETPEGLVAAWFGGTAERASDVGIWLSRLRLNEDGTTWTEPVEIDDGRHADGQLYPCWNPVLFQPSNGPLLLFYRIGPSPREWWGLARTSTDDGRTWSRAVSLPVGVLGPIRAKPVEIRAGMLLAGSSTEHDGWVVHTERLDAPVQLEEEWHRVLASPDSWTQSGGLNVADELAVIQPTILMHSPARLQILARSRQGVIAETWSNDGGHTWEPMTATALPNPSAAIDSVRLTDGRFLLVYNPIPEGRHKLAVTLSDDGRTWHQALMLEDGLGEYSYPAVIQSRTSLVHVTYTWKRQRIRHVVLDPALLSGLDQP